MFVFEQICKEVEKLNPKTYAKIVSQKSTRVLDELTKVSGEGLDGIAIYTGLILGAVISDGKVAEEEFAIINPMLDIALGMDVTIEHVKQYLKYFKQESKEYKQFVKSVDALFDEISGDLQTDIIVICLLVCGVDGNVSFKERMWLKSLFKN